MYKFYLGALEAMIKMGSATGDDVSQYVQLQVKGKAFLEQNLLEGPECPRPGRGFQTFA